MSESDWRKEHYLGKKTEQISGDMQGSNGEVLFDEAREHLAVAQKTFEDAQEKLREAKNNYEKAKRNLKKEQEQFNKERAKGAVSGETLQRLIKADEITSELRTRGKNIEDGAR